MKIVKVFDPTLGMPDQETEVKDGASPFEVMTEWAKDDSEYMGVEDGILSATVVIVDPTHAEVRYVLTGDDPDQTDRYSIQE